MVILSAENLSKTARDIPLFENVFLALEDGEKTGIVGRNGAGKSTFLRCLMGITAPDEGTVSMKKGTEAVLLEQNVTYPEGTTLSGFLYLQQSRAVRLLADYQKALDEGTGSAAPMAVRADRALVRRMQGLPFFSRIYNYTLPEAAVFCPPQSSANWGGNRNFTKIIGHTTGQSIKKRNVP